MTSPRPALDEGDVTEMSPQLRRHPGDPRLPGELVVTLSGDVSATFLRRRGDVSDVALVRAQAIFGLPSRSSCPT